MDYMLEIESLKKKVIGLEEFRSEIKNDFETIMHEVKQGRQDSKNATIAVSSVSEKLDELLPHILPNTRVGNIGLFPRLKVAEERISEIENVIRTFKGQLAVVAAIFGGLGAIFILLIKAVFTLFNHS